MAVIDPHVDLFARLSAVDGTGRSRKVSGGVVRLGPEDAGTVRIELDPVVGWP